MKNIKPKRKQVTCTCKAYKFPHRLDSGACRTLYNEEAKAESDSLESLGLISEFQVDNKQPLRF